MAPEAHGRARPQARVLRSRLIATLAILAPTLFVLSYFPPALLLSGTTTAGGDLGSHNYAASYARMLLFTQLHLTGWVPGNYAGFPLFQMYFPLPFALMAGASLLLDPNVAFKLVTIAGIVLLPCAAFFVLHRAKTPYPGPAIGAALVLLFLFQDGNSMWGGNMASTLAGEFAYSISLSIALVYLGVSRRALESTRASILAAVLVAALALTHAYTVLWVGLASAIVVAARVPFLASAKRLVLVFGGAAALCGFWLVPLLWYAPWTTAYRHLWTINSVTELLPRALWPVVIAVVAVPALLLVRGRDASRGYWRHSALLWAAAGAAALEYLAAPNFGVVDIRFLPFLQLSLCLLAAAGMGHLLRGVRAAGLWIPIAFLGVVLLVQSPGERMRQWIQWDYEGFERKASWPVFSQIADYLRGNAGDPRVAYEHSPDNEALGTIRAFENLPLFSGRSTLEGVNLQASVTSPFIFYIQSEISQVMSCPFAEWGCSRTDLSSGIAHLKMMNVSDFIVRGDYVKALAADQPDLVPRTTIGSYNIYRIDHNRTGYAVALSAAPYLVSTRNWKEAAYRWFKHARPNDPVPVFVSDAAPTADPKFAGVFSELPQSPPHRPLVAATPKERVDAERITVFDCRPGEPVLIRVSYHPRWRSTTGERVWLAGPGFMLVFPERDAFELVYSETTATRTGMLLTVVAMLCVATGLWWFRRFSGSRSVRFDADGGRPAACPERGRGEASRNTEEKTTVLAMARYTRLVVGVSVVVVAVAGVRARRLDADAVYRSAQQRYDRGDLDGARAGFIRARTLAPLSNTAIHSSYFEAITLFRQERWVDAKRAFERLLATFPEAAAAPEAMYHVGLCDERLGDTAGAAAAFDETERGSPDTLWGQLSRARAAELVKMRSKKP